MNGILLLEDADKISIAMFLDLEMLEVGNPQRHIHIHYITFLDGQIDCNMLGGTL